MPDLIDLAVFGTIVTLIAGALLRWLLRINHICKRLDQLASAAGYADATRSLPVKARSRTDTTNAAVNS